MRFTGFIGPSYVMNSRNVDCQRCIGLYPELHELGRGKAQEVASLRATPGHELLATIGSGPYRGVWFTSTGVLYVVSGNKLYSVDSAWSATERGTLNTASGYVSMADNGIQLVIVDGSNGYYLTLLTNVFAEITDDEFIGDATHVTNQDGYFIFNRSGTDQFYISALDGITFDGSDFSSADQYPGSVKGLVSFQGNLWIFKERTTEPHFNDGSSDFPFVRIQGASFDVGLAAPFSIAKGVSTIFWLGKDENGAGAVYMAQGYQPQRISTHPIENEIQSYDEMSDAIGYFYQANGHQFYVLNFPSADTTWVYDVTTRMWHERVYLNEGQLERQRGIVHAFAYDTHVVGDYENGKLYALRDTVYTDAGNPIVRERTSPHVDEDGHLIFYESFQLDMQPGVGLDGLSTTQGADPQAMLQFSKDGGATWSNEKWKSLGKIGQTLHRAKWNRLGAARDMVFKVRVTDPVKVVFIGAELKMMKGAS